MLRRRMGDASILEMFPTVAQRTVRIITRRRIVSPIALERRGGAYEGRVSSNGKFSPATNTLRDCSLRRRRERIPNRLMPPVASKTKEPGSGTGRIDTLEIEPVNP